MSDKFHPLPITHLLTWILSEYQQTTGIFGIPCDLFFRPAVSDPFRLTRYGETLETPFGVAAGPHTQLSQNIIAAWLCGARYLELKTIQTLDQLNISKPCIDMRDVGYNCEWSQELTLAESFDQYLNAWILLHLLRHKLGFTGKDSGFIFNMSLGYNLAGILKPNVQRFLDRMHAANREITAKFGQIRSIYPDIDHLAVPGQISNNVTLSTMHGCPPQEIEKIARYLIEERGLHTTVKLNPTLLGPKELRAILNDCLGFGITVPDGAFEHDLTYPAALDLIRSLQDSARRAGVQFSVKLTNTLAVENAHRALPDNERMLYLSGRALHPISIAVAKKLQQDLAGRLDVTFSAGVDCFNLADVLAADIKPITTCSDILKPGGYLRLRQYVDVLRQQMDYLQARSIPEFILKKAGPNDAPNIQAAGLKNLAAYADRVLQNPAYQQAAFPYDSIKTERELTPFDCVQAPCTVTCAVNQAVPEYLRQTADGDFAAAYRTIMRDNPLPNITGMVCDHLCQSKCTRMNIDDSLLIREIKRFNAERCATTHPVKVLFPNGPRVAIIGAGPSGLTCAHFLALAGFAVTVYEAKGFAGGMAADAIPAFRLDEARIQKDIATILNLGVTIHFRSEIDAARFDDIRKDYPYVYVAVGAQHSKRLGLPGEEAEGVTDQLRFLAAVRQRRSPDLGRRVAIIGGGNSCMDAARTAHRLVGPAGEVTVVYRRTRAEMPADPHEIKALQAEGIKIMELTAPEALTIENNRIKAITCAKMKLGEPDRSGRPRPVKIPGSHFDLPVDSVISAIGQEVAADFFPGGSLRVDSRTLETQLSNVFAGGDAVRGASTLIKAMGDGKKVAREIINRAGPSATSNPNQLPKRDVADYYTRLATRTPGVEIPRPDADTRFRFDLVHPTLDEADARREAARCLQCHEICNICVTVCPNRANIALAVEPTAIRNQKARRVDAKTVLEEGELIEFSQPYQVINIPDLCNECGNCTTFCPTSGAPYRLKPRLHLSAESLAESDQGFRIYPDSIEAKINGSQFRLDIGPDCFSLNHKQIRATIDRSTLTVHSAELNADFDSVFDFRPIFELIFLWKSLQRTYLVDHG